MTRQDYFYNSKIRDENGDLLTVYHSSTSERFYIFDREKLGENTLDMGGDCWMQATSLIGFWFNSNNLSETDESYEGYNGDGWAMECNLDISKPYTAANLQDLAGDIYSIYIDAKQAEDEDIDDITERIESYDPEIAREAAKIFVEWLENEGYDGCIIDNDEEFGGKSYVILNSNQAKLTTNTDPTTDDDVRR